jgi:hypothetical protein
MWQRVKNLRLARRATVHVDRSQIEQVVLNVLRNAMESIGRDGTIEVTWRDRALTIADSGAGIDEASRDEFFTPFFTTKREGRGLGLTIARARRVSYRPKSIRNSAPPPARFCSENGRWWLVRISCPLHNHTRRGLLRLPDDEVSTWRCRLQQCVQLFESWCSFAPLISRVSISRRRAES